MSMRTRTCRIPMPLTVMGGALLGKQPRPNSLNNPWFVLVFVIVTMGVMGCTGASSSNDRGPAVEGGTEALEPAPAGWRPDLVVSLSRQLLEQGATMGLDDFLGDLGWSWVGVVPAHAELSVKDLRVGKASCERCIGVVATLGGTVTVPPIWTSANGRVALDVRIHDVEQKGNTWTVKLSPHNARVLDLTLRGKERPYLRRKLEEQLTGDTLDGAAYEMTIPLLGKELPIRDAEVRVVSHGVQLQMLTVADDVQAVIASPHPSEGWVVSVSETTARWLLSDMLVEMDVTPRSMRPDLTALTLQEDNLSMRLRLSHSKANGHPWWHEQDISGRVVAGADGIRLDSVEVENGSRSKTPAYRNLAFIARGVIRRKVKKSLRDGYSPAAIYEAQMGDALIEIVVDSIHGGEGRVAIEGSVKGLL